MFTFYDRFYAREYSNFIIAKLSSNVFNLSISSPCSNPNHILPHPILPIPSSPKPTVPNATNLPKSQPLTNNLNIPNLITQTTPNKSTKLSPHLNLFSQTRTLTLKSKVKTFIFLLVDSGSLEARPTRVNES